MKIVMTVTKEVPDQAAAIELFEEVKTDIAIKHDCTLSGYTNAQIDYENPNGPVVPE